QQNDRPPERGKGQDPPTVAARTGREPEHDRDHAGEKVWDEPEVAANQKVFGVACKSRGKPPIEEHILRRRRRIVNDTPAASVPARVGRVKRKRPVEGLAIAALIVELPRVCRVETKERGRDDD